MVAVSVPVQGPYGVEHVLTAYVSAWAINQALRDQGMTPGWRIAVLDTAERLIARTLSEDRYDPGIGENPTGRCWTGFAADNCTSSRRT